MKKVYVAGAISAPNIEMGLRNIRKGILMGAELLNLHYSPYIPHLDYQLNLIQDDIHIDVETYYRHDLEWLGLCDCMLVLPDWKNSKGVKAEIEFAKKKGIPIYFSKEELVMHEPTHEVCPQS